MSNNASRVLLSALRKWAASDRIALGVLEELGYRIVETGKKIVLNNVEVGEIDILAMDNNGEIYAVEVKAGRLDVSGVRQAYINALLLNGKPMVICKGFADDSAHELADKLGVKVIELTDIFLVESEEIYTIMKEVVEETLTDYFEIFYGFNFEPRQEYMEILNAIYTSQSMEEAASKLNMNISNLAKKIEEMKKNDILPRWASKY